VSHVCVAYHLHPNSVTRPGDHVLWKGEAERRTAIVQSVNAVDRTAKILYADTRVTDIVSVLELDPHGSTDFSPANSQSISEGLGVCLGELVLVHSEGTTNGLEPPRVPKIGEIETWVKEHPAEVDGEYIGWRKDIAEMGTQIAAARVANGVIREEQRSMNSNFDSLEWFGEVTKVG
jgi:ubiquitin-conjugating enzyme E2 O